MRHTAFKSPLSYPSSYGGFIKGILRGVRCTKSLRVLFLHRRPPSWTTLVLYSRAVFLFNEPAFSIMVGSLKMNTTLEYSTRVVQEGDRRCKKSTLNDLAYLTPLRIPLMNPVSVSDALCRWCRWHWSSLYNTFTYSFFIIHLLPRPSIVTRLGTVETRNTISSSASSSLYSVLIKQLGESILLNRIGFCHVGFSICTAWTRLNYLWPAAYVLLAPISRLHNIKIQ
jgi:hypothetical protein